MSLTVAFQMDAIESVDIRADSTFRLMLEAAARGHELFYYNVPDLLWRRGKVMAAGHPVTVQADPAAPATLGPRELRDLAELDVVWLRQ
ncbi:MAG: glutathione synthase, partial [Pseudomonadota bacterium]